MKLIYFFLLVTLISLSNTQNMRFDLDRTRYEASGQFWLLSVPINGGANPLIYSFQQLPTGWIQSGNNVQIPRSAFENGGTFQLKVVVTDNQASQLRRTLLVRIIKGELFIGDFSFNQDFSRFEINNEATSNSFSSQSSSGSSSGSSSVSTPSSQSSGSITGTTGTISVPTTNSGNSGSTTTSGTIVRIPQSNAGNSASSGSNFGNSVSGISSQSNSGSLRTSTTTSTTTNTRTTVSGSSGSGSVGITVPKVNINTSKGQIISSTNQGSTSTIFGKTTSTAGVIPLITGVSGAGNSISASSTSFQTALSSLPSNSELNALINSGNIVALTKTIQAVVTSSLSCQHKIGYLNDFIGRIQSFIEIKKSQASQFQNLIDKAQAQIQILNDQIAEFQRLSGELDTVSLQNEQSQTIADLQVAYSSFNGANIDLTPFNLNISANLQSVNVLTNLIEETKVKVENDQVVLQQTNEFILSLQRQLIQARTQKATLQSRILQQQALIVTTQSEVDFLNAETVILNNQINKVNSNRNQLQIVALSLENKVENIRKKIEAYNIQKAKYQTEITSLRLQVQKLISNTNPSALNALNIVISNLESSIPDINRQIDTVRFTCNGASNFTVTTLEGTITYVFSNPAFVTYFTNNFGESNTNTAQAMLGPVSSATLTPISIFSPRWIAKYGRSFGQDIDIIAQDVSTSTSQPNFQFNTDFSCSSVVGIQSGTGVIQKIDANIIQIISGGQQIRIQLASCSVIELLNKNDVSIGDNINWRGVKLTPSLVQAQSVLIS